jgi:hypothetical protein
VEGTTLEDFQQSASSKVILYFEEQETTAPIPTIGIELEFELDLQRAVDVEGVLGLQYILHDLLESPATCVIDTIRVETSLPLHEYTPPHVGGVGLQSVGLEQEMIRGVDDGIAVFLHGGPAQYSLDDSVSSWGSDLHTQELPRAHA